MHNRSVVRQQGDLNRRQFICGDVHSQPLMLLKYNMKPSDAHLQSLAGLDWRPSKRPPEDAADPCGQASDVACHQDLV